MLRIFSLTLALAAPVGALAHDGPHDSYEVNGKEFQFSKGEMVVESGKEVTITFHNKGRIAHNLAIPKLGVTTPTIQGGRTATVTFTPETAGSYNFICSVPGHAQAGMHGKLIVK